jgi:phosphoserine phosphatase
MTPPGDERIGLPPGTRLAVIDLDGTLLKGMNAERVFYFFLFVHGHVGALRMAGFLLSLVKDIIQLGFRKAIATNARILKGEAPQDVSQWARAFGNVFLRKAVPDDLRAKILSLKRDGCRVVLLSGSLQVLVDQLRDKLEAEILIGTELEVVDGTLSGRKTGIFPYGRL